MRGRWELTDEQCAVAEPVLRRRRRADRRGRQWHDTCAVLHGVLWVLGTGRNGVNCPKDIRLSRPATAGSSNGYGVGRWNRRCGDRRSPTCAARSRRSSLSPLLTAFLSRYLCKAHRRLSASLWRRFSPVSSSTNCQPASSATKPMTLSRSTKKLADEYHIELIAPNQQRRS